MPFNSLSPEFLLYLNETRMALLESFIMQMEAMHDPAIADNFNTLPWLAVLIAAATAALFVFAYLIRKPCLRSPSMPAKPEFRIVMSAAIGFVILALPINYFHEFGHSLVCMLSGGEAKMSAPTIMGIRQFCLNSSSNIELSRAMGGSFGVIGSVVWIIFYNRYKQNAMYLGLLAACLALASGEALKAFFEPMNFEFYSTPVAATLFSVIQLFSLAAFVLFLGGKARKEVSSDTYLGAHQSIEDYCTTALLESFGFSIVKPIGMGIAIGAMSTILAAILVPFVFESRKPQAVLQEPMPNTSVKIEPIRYLQ